MTIEIKNILILIISLWTLISYAQSPVQTGPNDSLFTVWQDETQADSVRIEAYNKYILKGFLFSKPDSAYNLASELIEFCKSHKDYKGQASVLNLQGVSWAVRGELSKASDYYERSLKISEEIGDKKGIARSLNNLGINYKRQSDPKALDYYKRALKIFEEIEDNTGIVSSQTNIGAIYKNQGDYPEALGYFERALLIRENLGDKNGIAGLLNNMGAIYKDQGDYPKALTYFERALKITEELGDKNGIAGQLNNIGIIYKDQGDNLKALTYLERALKIKEELGDKNGIAGPLNNIGLIYKNQGDYQTALTYFERSLKIKEELGDKKGSGSSLNNIGLNYEAQGNNAKALTYYKRSLKISEQVGNKNGIANTLNNMGNLYNSLGDYSKAIDYCKRSLVLAKSVGNIAFQKNACQCLYHTHKTIGNGNEALLYLENISMLDDSLHMEETAKKLQQMEFAKVMLADSLKTEEEKLQVRLAHNIEVIKKNRQRNILIGSGLLTLILAIGFFSRWRFVKKSRDAISKEKDRSENLLLNILPAEIAEELKLKGSAEARDFDQVSILFTDFKEFTQLSEKLSAKELVGEINYCFKAFDDICEKYGVEKIKTIGDSYMAAAGLPVSSLDSAQNMVSAALEMAAFIVERKAEREKSGELGFEMRSGIHTGNVVAGIVGVKKFQYDIWGDTVNTASRIESHGEVGKVNISQTTYDLIKNDTRFAFLPRGKVNAKGKGQIEMYFVSKVD